MQNVFPELPYTLKFVLILVSGVILLRLAGKRSISQMTVPETVLMIAIGTLLIQPLAPRTEWAAVYGGTLLVGGMVLLSFMQIWMPKFRKWVYGVPSVLIRNGSVDVGELKRARMTMDQLEMRLRQQQVGNVLDVKKAALEPSGQMSVVLSENKKSAEKGDVQMILDELQLLKTQMNSLVTTNSAQMPAASGMPKVTGYSQDTLFEESDEEDRHGTNLKM